MYVIKGVYQGKLYTLPSDILWPGDMFESKEVARAVQYKLRVKTATLYDDILVFKLEEVH